MQLRPCVAEAVAIDVIRTLAWELLYAAGTAIKSKKKKKKKVADVLVLRHMVPENKDNLLYETL